MKVCFAFQPPVAGRAKQYIALGNKVLDIGIKLVIINITM